MSDPVTHNILHQLLKRPIVVAALLIITGTILLAVFAYALAPDHSPDANRMIVEMGARSPGYSKQLLLLPAARAAGAGSATKTFFFPVLRIFTITCL